MCVEGDSLEDRRVVARRKLDEYTSHTNQMLGITGFGTALACVGLELSSPFAFFGMVFILIAWADGARNAKPYIDYLRSVEDKSAKPLAILKRNHVALIGWLFLGSVAIHLVHA